MCIHRCYYDELSFGSLGTQEVTQVETNIWAWLDLESINRFQKNGIFKGSVLKLVDEEANFANPKPKGKATKCRKRHQNPNNGIFRFFVYKMGRELVKLSWRRDQFWQIKTQQKEEITQLETNIWVSVDP